MVRQLTGGLPAGITVPENARAGVTAAEDPLSLKTAEEQRREAELKAAAMPEKADNLRDVPQDARLETEMAREQQRLLSQEKAGGQKAAGSLDEMIRQEQLHRIRQTEKLQRTENEIVREREMVKEKEIE